jgi:hypothetical protein
MSTPQGPELRLDVSSLQRPVLYLDVYLLLRCTACIYTTGLVLHLDVSTPQGPAQNLDVSTLQVHVLHLDVSTPQGPELHLYISTL